MPYNPGIQNREGYYLFQGITGGATAKASGQIAGAEGIAKGISSAGNSIAGGISKLGEEHEMTEKELSLLNGKATAYHQAGTMPTEDYQKFMDGNIATKRALISQADTSILLGTEAGHKMLQQAQTAHLNAVTGSIPAQTEHTQAVTEGIRQGNAQTQSQIDAAQRNKSNLDAWTKQVGGAPPAPPAASNPPGTPNMTVVDSGMSLNPNAPNPFTGKLTTQQLYGYY